MKKNRTYGLMEEIGLFKMIKIMRFTIFILFLSLSQTFAVNSYSQQAKLSLDMRNARVEDVIDKIEKNSEFFFMYNKNMVDVDRKIDIQVKEKSVNEVLDKIFSNTDISYSIKDRQILLINSRMTGTGNESIFQQQKSISGKVTDSSGGSLPGVSVIVKGTTTGVITDANGNYSLANVIANGTLQFSFVGMKTKEIKIGGQTNINVVLEEETIGIEEVVAIGYGSVRKSDLTGSVAKVTNKESGETTNSSVEQMLQGKAAGIQIMQNTGAPGEGMTFLVRGANSMSGNNQPLIVLDGYPLETGNSTTTIGSQGFEGAAPAGNVLAGLNPNDIESVEILKDASSTAIYGSRGANGVVLITTKRGKSGKDRIEYNFRSDISTLRKKIDVLHGQDYMNYSNEGFLNSAKPIPYTPETFDGRYPDFNWQDLIFQTSFSQDHQLTISGGNEDMKYAVIGGYSDLEGIVKYASRFKRGSIRINLDRNIGKRVKIGTNITGSMTYNQAILQSPVNASGINASAILGALFGRPISTAYNEDGTLNTTFQGNPLTLLKLNTNEAKAKSIVFNAFGEYAITKELKFRVNGGTNFSYSNRDVYYPRGTFNGDQAQGSAYKGESVGQNFLIENTLTFNKVIKQKHRINAVAGYTYQSWQNSAFGITVSRFANDHLTFYNLNNANVVNKPSTSYQEYALSSYLARANYTYDDRYIFTMTVRNDGSTRLAEGYKWALFPSIALGWNVHNESFMKGFKAISEMKLRASYGTSGNQSVGIGQTKSYYNAISSLVNNTAVTGFLQNGLANNMLGWETTKQVNLGFNLALLENRYTMGFDYYKKSTTDLLLNTPLPSSSGYTGLTMNSGEIQNEGYEFELGAVLLKGPVKWNTSANLSINRNKVVSLGNFNSINGPSFNLYGQYSGPWHIAKVGSPIGSYYGFVLDGIYQTQEEIDNGPIETVTGVEPGLWRFKDISGPDGKPDGKIDTNDRTIIGNPYPDFTFGVTNNLSYKNFSLSFFIMGSVGNDILNLNNFVLTGMDVTMYPNNITYEAYNNRWVGPGTSNFYAKPNTNAGAFYKRPTDALVEDGTFYRLKNLTLSYDIPVKKLNVFRSLKVFATGTNLITITNYSGYDPEISSRGMNAMSPGVDLGAIPQVRSYSFGLTMNF